MSLKEVVDKKWLAVYTRSRYEKKVADHLTEHGITSYLPLMKTLRQWSDRKKWVEVPLFRSYVFVNIELPNYRKALEAAGAVYIVRFEGQPAVIPEGQIEMLKALLDSSTDFEITTEEFLSGEKVEVTRGPMLGYKGTFVEYKGKKRIMLRIDAVGQSLLIEISPAIIKRSDEVMR
jgi:transcription antitermination factor NusG